MKATGEVMAIGQNFEQALLKANKKFEKRFRKMEELAEKPLTEYTIEEYDKLWKKAKKECH